VCAVKILAVWERSCSSLSPSPINTRTQGLIPLISFYFRHIRMPFFEFPLLFSSPPSSFFPICFHSLLSALSRCLLGRHLSCSSSSFFLPFNQFFPPLFQAATIGRWIFSPPIWHFPVFALFFPFLTPSVFPFLPAEESLAFFQVSVPGFIVIFFSLDGRGSAWFTSLFF